MQFSYINISEYFYYAQQLEYNDSIHYLYISFLNCIVPTDKKRQ